MTMQKVQVWKGGKVIEEYEVPLYYHPHERAVPMSFALPIEKQIEQFQKMSSGKYEYPDPTDTEQEVRKMYSHAYDFLEEAVDQMKDRAVQRDTANGGKAERSMAKTVAAFNALTGHNLTEEEGWEFMIMLKLVRGRQGSFRADDYVDAAAYSGLLGECAFKTR